MSSGTAAPWIIPHTGTQTVGNLDVSWATYITNDDPAAHPYAVTVIVSWTTGAIAGKDNDVVRLQSNFWSPDGCVSEETHPFAAPCQPFFYGLATVPDGAITFSSIELHEFAVDLDQAILSFPSARAALQQEQVSTLEADAKESVISLEGSWGLEEAAGTDALVSADSDPGSPTTAAGGAALNAPGDALEELQSDCCDEIGLKLDVPAGQIGDAAASTAAKATDASASRPTARARPTRSAVPAHG